MRCDVCGTEVQPQQKFCMECGARLHHPAGDDRVTGDVPTVPELPAVSNPMFDPVTGQLIGLPRGSDSRELAAPPGRPPSATPAAGTPATEPPAVDDDATNVLPAIGEPMTTFAPPDPTPGAGLPWQTYLGPPTPGSDYPAFPAATEHDPTRVQQPVPPPPARAVDPTGILPSNYAPAPYEPDYDPRYEGGYVPWETEEPAGPLPGQTFRVRPLLALTVLAAAAAVTAMAARIVTITPDPQPNWKLNDFGTNLTVAGIVIGITMIGGALAWCTGFRWGAGLAGGAGAALAGWAGLVLGAAETAATSGWPPSLPRTGEMTRELGYWALAGAGGLGVLVLLVSLSNAGNDRRAGLDPWVAALGAIATVAAALGPLVPLNDADLDLNWSSPVGSDWPSVYFAVRFGSLGLLLLCGVFGFLLVRRYGLGLAIGSAVGIGWLTVTSATEQTDSPIGPAYWNPGSAPPGGDGKPYVVTVAGVGLLLFFGIVATALALLDND